MGLGVGITSFYLVRTGKLKPNRYFGAAPKVFLSSFVAYWAGKMSYILSDEYIEKFLKDAPESETAYYIRKDRGLQQPWTAIRDFGQEDTEEDDDDNYIFKINITIPSFQSILQSSLDGKENIVLSDKEKEILDECSDRSYIYYSMPLSILCGGLMLGAQKKGLISTVRATNSKWIKKLPVFPFRNRTFHGILFGFALGQILYLLSSDYEDSILEHAPEGELAALIRKRKETNKETKEILKNLFEEKKMGRKLKMRNNSDYSSEDKTTVQEGNKKNSIGSHEVLKSSDEKLTDIYKIDLDTHSTYFVDYKDLKSIDWFGKPEMDLKIQEFKRNKQTKIKVESD